ncbi:MAG: hypothetical protein OXI96_03940 [Acidimicrobiaceae bacterium]|nr:hypothetical protein [Acidimicrobiaceae bacterium]
MLKRLRISSIMTHEFFKTSQTLNYIRQHDGEPIEGLPQLTVLLLIEPAVIIYRTLQLTVLLLIEPAVIIYRTLQLTVLLLNETPVLAELCAQLIGGSFNPTGALCIGLLDQPSTF